MASQHGVFSPGGWILAGRAYPFRGVLVLGVVPVTAVACGLGYAPTIARPVGGATHD